MTMTKKTNQKPEMTVIEVEMQQMICVSGEETFSTQEADDEDFFTGEYD